MSWTPGTSLLCSCSGSRHTEMFYALTHMCNTSFISQPRAESWIPAGNCRCWKLQLRIISLTASSASIFPPRPAQAPGNPAAGHKGSGARRNSENQVQKSKQGGKTKRLELPQSPGRCRLSKNSYSMSSGSSSWSGKSRQGGAAQKEGPESPWKAETG